MVRQALNCCFPIDGDDGDQPAAQTHPATPPSSLENNVFTPKKVIAGASGHPAWRPRSPGSLTDVRASKQADVPNNNAAPKASAAEAAVPKAGFDEVLGVKRVVVGQKKNEEEIEEYERAIEAYALAIRADLKSCSSSGDYSKYGTVIEDRKDGDPVAVAVELHPALVEEFRALLWLIKRHHTWGAGVVLGSAQTYQNAAMLISLDGEAVCAVPQQSALTESALRESPLLRKTAEELGIKIPPGGEVPLGKHLSSVAKVEIKSPGPRHRIPDLVNTTIDQYKVNHLGCFSHMVPYYAKFYMRPVAYINAEPSVFMPEWSEEASKQFQRFNTRDADGNEIGLRGVIVALDEERRNKGVPFTREEIKAMTDFWTIPAIEVNGREMEDVWHEAYTFGGLMAETLKAKPKEGQERAAA
jgi:hypothetical protein